MYEVVEYEKNRGSVGKARIVFIGASFKFVHKVIRDMLLVGGFDDCHSSSSTSHRSRSASSAISWKR